MEHWTDFTLEIDIDAVLRGQGADPTITHRRSPRLGDAAAAAIQQGMQKLHPGAVVQEVKVVENRQNRVLLENGHALTGTWIAHQLAGATAVAGVLCTISAELETHAAAVGDPVLALALDGLGNAAIEALSLQVCARLAESARARDLATGMPLSPGEPDWPVEVGQPQIFALLDPAAVGIRLTSGGMMIPKKSISFITAIGKNIKKTHPCETCSLKNVCRYRRE